MEAEIQAIFDEMYTLTLTPDTETRTRTVTVTDPDTGIETEEEEEYEVSILRVKLTVKTIEEMLSGNFKEENIHAAISEIRKNSNEYRTLFGECSVYLERLSNGSLETNLLKGVGSASNAVGKLIGSIPKVKDGPVDELLIDKGEKIRSGAQEISKEVIESFAEVSNPNTGGFINKLEDMDKIYNHTKEICFDKDNLYLIAG